jgi:hypothetical protein
MKKNFFRSRTRIGSMDLDNIKIDTKIINADIKNKNSPIGKIETSPIKQSSKIPQNGKNFY